MSLRQLVAPRTTQDAGLSPELVTQLALKTLYYAGELTGAEWAKRLGVAFGVIEPSLEVLRQRRHCEVVGATMVGGPSYRYRLTDDGRSAAVLHLQQDHYVGALPVPLAQYRDYMTSLARETPFGVSRRGIRSALSHLVLSESVLDELGPAVNGGHSIFIYGPPGNGKTAIAKAIAKLLRGEVAVPRALEVEGRIIRVFDPHTHDERPATVSEGMALSLDVDARWAICRRPVVTAGGELTLEMLELNYDGRVGFHRAPLQLMAGGGMLIIDDFGRQRCTPRDLLNRWMVPLENGVDYLTLHSGLKFEVPFQVFVAFATNLKPAELVDEAFLRRVQYNFYAADPSPLAFGRIFELCCRDRGIPFDPSLVQHLLNGYYRTHAQQRRACHPRDLINQALLLAEFRAEPPALTSELLDAACASYFVDSNQ